MKWGESEFGLSNAEKEMIYEIYEEINYNADNSFSKEELFKHLRDTQITPNQAIFRESDEEFNSNQ